MSKNIRMLISDTLSKILYTGDISLRNRENILISFYMTLSDFHGPPNFHDKDLINKLIDSIQNKYGGMFIGIKSKSLLYDTDTGRTFIRREHIKSLNKKLNLINFEHNYIYLPTFSDNLSRVVILTQDGTNLLRLKTLEVLELYKQESGRPFGEWSGNLKILLLPLILLITAFGHPIMKEIEFSRLRSQTIRVYDELDWDGVIAGAASVAPYIADPDGDSRSFAQLRRYTGRGTIHL
jgi:hypothetical protein